jgi:hypothetical protein
MPFTPILATLGYVFSPDGRAVYVSTTDKGRAKLYRAELSPNGTAAADPALVIGESPRFEISLQSPDALAGDAMNRARVIILNDVPIGDSVAAKLVSFVEGGGGLLMAVGPRATWPASRAAWLPASIGPPVDRTRGAAARLSGMDYGHAVFEPFRAPRSGDFSSARFYSYRNLGAAKDASVLARASKESSNRSSSRASTPGNPRSSSARPDAAASSCTRPRSI